MSFTNGAGRDMCDPCPINTITQGSIFNYAYNEDFGDEEDLGLLISARCDLANDKAPKYSYLPVISLKKFTLFFSLRKILNEEISNKKAQIRQIIVAEGHSSDALELYGIEPSIEKLITKEKNQKKANDLLSEINKISKALEKGWKTLSKNDLELAPTKK